MAQYDITFAKRRPENIPPAYTVVFISLMFIVGIIGCLIAGLS